MNLIKKTTLKDDIKQNIIEAIFNNLLKPGERVVETKLAKELGVSQSPVREAIRELEIMGIIESKPYLGSYVKKLTSKDIRDTYRVRACLEMLAVTEAMNNITEAHLEELDKILTKMKAAAEEQLTTEFVELDISFHRLIIIISNNNFLEKMWDTVHLGQWTFVSTRNTGKSLLELAERHEEILESLKERDAEKASRCIRIHIEELYEDILTRTNGTN